MRRVVIIERVAWGRSTYREIDETWWPKQGTVGEGVCSKNRSGRREMPQGRVCGNSSKRGGPWRGGPVVVWRAACSEWRGVRRVQWGTMGTVPCERGRKKVDIDVAERVVSMCAKYMCTVVVTRKVRH